MVNCTLWQPQGIKDRVTAFLGDAALYKKKWLQPEVTLPEVSIFHSVSRQHNIWFYITFNLTVVKMMCKHGVDRLLTFKSWERLQRPYKQGKWKVRTFMYFTKALWPKLRNTDNQRDKEYSSELLPFQASKAKRVRSSRLVTNVHFFIRKQFLRSIDNSVCGALRRRRWALSRCISRYCA